MSVKQCPTCKAEVADDRAVCPECGGQWLEDGSSEPPWRLEMERLKAWRESKVRRAGCFWLAAIAASGSMLLLAAGAHGLRRPARHSRPKGG
jgi:hypothetical protein